MLLLPVVAAVLLLIAFPKLLTGDFVEATVISIENYDHEIRIQFDARISSGTEWGATILRGGVFSNYGTGSKSRPHWTRVLPTWPKHKFMWVKLGIRDKSPTATGDPIGMLTIKEGETYRVTPSQPLHLSSQGCRLHVRRDNRLGL